MTIVRQVFILTHAAAQDAVAAALGHALSKGWRVAAAVCDPAGGLVAFGRLDGTPQPIGDFAIDKAYTAGTLGRATRAFGERMVSNPMLAAGLGNRARLLVWPGGLPIEIDGSLVGGIGVSGAADHEDEECAAAAIRLLVERHAAGGA